MILLCMGVLRWCWVALALIVLTGACSGGDQVTDTSVKDPFVTPGGQAFELINATTTSASLVDWAFAQFLAADVPEPVVESIAFAAESTSCLDFAGLAKRGDEGAVIVVCLPDDRICLPEHEDGFRAPAKLCILHELAHGWLFSHIDDGIEDAFTSHAGVDAWADPEARWHERGVEHAAETLAWGLMDRPLRMTRIGNPECHHLADGFRLLTGGEPLIDCD